jgi:hypothetical protein
MAGEQLARLGGWMIGNAAQDVGELSLWIDAVEFCRGDQSVNGCGPLSGTVRRDLMTGWSPLEAFRSGPRS